MILIDQKIKEIGASVISPYNEALVQAIGYDLTAKNFIVCEGAEVDHIVLGAMESVFVQCKETIKLPNDLCAFIHLRNSRIRQGLLLTAPVYHPGHETPVYFRVTNVSSQAISLSEGDSLATIMFESLDNAVQSPYAGTFQKEEQYRGMGSYGEAYTNAIVKAVKK